MELHEGVRNLQTVDDGVRGGEVRDRAEQIVPVTERTPTVLTAKQYVEFTNLKQSGLALHALYRCTVISLGGSSGHNCLNIE